MTITANCDYETDTIQFALDPEAQAILIQALPLVRDFCHDTDVREMLAPFPSIILEQFTVGAATLEQLADDYDGGRIFESEEARCALHVTLFALLYRLDSAQIVTPLPLFALLLARAIPFAVPPLALPPVEEMANLNQLPANALKTYEALRLWEKTKGNPSLPMHSLYQLGYALHQTGENSPTIKTLLKNLETVTGIFSNVMAQAALKDVAAGSMRN